MRMINGSGRSSGKRSRIAIAILFGSFFSILSSCSSYSPILYPGYDVLNPSEEVRKNPLAWTPEGNAVVNEAFLMWVLDLRIEIKRLRSQVKKGK
jgi:hypothetical protein